jgi:hypothetical protein
MTKLDEFIPEGEPIHPYDVYELLEGGAKLVSYDISAQAEDEDDYTRNRDKIGECIEIDGKKYFQTCNAPVRTRRFA